MSISESIMNDISKNVQNTLKSKKKRIKTDFSRYSTERLKIEIKKHEDNPVIFLKIYSILQVRNYPATICPKAQIQLEREKEKSITPIHYGYKSEQYSTEEEMIRGYIPPTYEELSESEKLIYNLM
jgi:hypothetical protein